MVAAVSAALITPMHPRPTVGKFLKTPRRSEAATARSSCSHGAPPVLGIAASVVTEASEQLKPRQVLRINNPHRNFVVIDHDQIIDAVALQQIQNFDRELVLVHRHRI